MSRDLFADPACPKWVEIRKGHRALIALADRHYTRQTSGSNQACRPGVNLCLLTDDARAAWVVWRPIPEVGRMDGLEAWECTLFRNESPALSSSLIEAATAITFRKWGWPPAGGLITAIGVDATSRRRSKSAPPGHCFREAGWFEFAHPSNSRGDLEDLIAPLPPPDRVWLRAPHPVRVALEAA